MNVLCEACSETGCSLNTNSFEIHITVKGASAALFREFCNQIGVKPVLLDLQMNGGIHDVMTSSTIRDVSFATALVEANRQRDLIASRFDVVRVKIETRPDHADAPTTANGRCFNAGQYFETHVAVLIDDANRVRQIGRACGDWHTSRNALKVNQAGSTFMCTLRQTLPLERHRACVDLFVSRLKQEGIDVKKIRSEFALYDTNQQHDSAWMRITGRSRAYRWLRLLSGTNWL